MARKKIGEKAVQSTDKLKNLVKEYYVNKEDEKTIKKLLSEQNAELKQLLTEREDFKNSDGDYVYNTGELVCKLSNRLTKTLNEDKLLEIAKKHALNNLIKTKEYVDTDILEDLMYKGQIPDDIKAEIAECIQVKTTPTLTVKALTKKGDN